MPASVAEQVLLGCASAPDWAAALAAGRPYADLDALVAAATEGILALDEKGLAAALAGHARIGAPAGGAGAREQSGVAGLDEAGRAALAEGNRAYEERFGHVYLVRGGGPVGRGAARPAARAAPERRRTPRRRSCGPSSRRSRR